MTRAGPVHHAGRRRGGRQDNPVRAVGSGAGGARRGGAADPGTGWLAGRRTVARHPAGRTVDWAPQAETLLHFAARAEHVAKTIRPAIEAGTWVVCDRFYNSTLAYQGYGPGRRQGLHPVTDRPAGDRPGPDDRARCRRRTSRLAECAQRGGDNDRYERLDAAFHAPCATGVSRHRRGGPRRDASLLDAAGDIQAVHTAIMTAVWTRLAQ